MFLILIINFNLNSLTAVFEDDQGFGGEHKVVNLLEI